MSLKKRTNKNSYNNWTPQQKRDFENSLEKWHKILEPLYKPIREAEILTDKDYKIMVY